MTKPCSIPLPTTMDHAPPAHLSRASREWWISVISNYNLEPHHLLLLQTACEALDRLQQAREILAIEGITVAGLQGTKPHPAIAIERDSRIGFLRAHRELDLDAAGTNAPRPPALASNSRK